MYLLRVNNFLKTKYLYLLNCFFLTSAASFNNFPIGNIACDNTNYTIKNFVCIVGDKWYQLHMSIYNHAALIAFCLNFSMSFYDQIIFFSNMTSSIFIRLIQILIIRDEISVSENSTCTICVLISNFCDIYQ